jgi:phospholipid/cholesterol/gamma-HCH transport system substrate-binding protein
MLEARTNEKYPVIFADPGSGGMIAGLSDAAGQANALMARLNNLVANNEGSLTRTLNNVEAFSATLSEHKDDVGAFVQELRALIERLDKMAVKIDAAVDRVAGAASDNPDSVVSQVQRTAISFRQLAEKLDKSVGDRSAAITADAERDLRELELFLKDSRRLVDNLDHMVHKFEASPTGFLLGGQQSPKY